MPPARWARAGCALGRIPAAALDRADYVAGDDYRRIDWNLCAGMTSCDDSAPGRDEHSVYLLVDSSASMTGGDGAKFAVARSWARAVGSMAWQAAPGGRGRDRQHRVEARLRPHGGCRQAAVLERFFNGAAQRAAPRQTCLLPSTISSASPAAGAGDRGQRFSRFPGVRPLPGCARPGGSSPWWRTLSRPMSPA